jgi:hypothetical protein
VSCTACELSKADPSNDRHWDPTGKCKGCIARALASTGAHVESQELQAITPKYRSELEIFFGESWKLGHERVKEWADRITSVARQRAAGAKP